MLSAHGLAPRAMVAADGSAPHGGAAMSSISTRGENVAAQRWFLIGLVVLFVGLSVQYSHKALYSSHKDAGHRSAILRWQEQLRNLDNDVDISQRYNYPNPPIMAVL